MTNKAIRIVFMGTPEFAVATLKALVENNYNVVGVITNPDKPAGRGQKIQQSAVKRYALGKKLTLLQPAKLKNPDFLKQLKELKADLQIVVAFRILPEVVWSTPSLGTFNLHASLLPNYRGAAPVNWTIINGEKETGVTTFFIEQNIDTGKIIFQEKVPIDDVETAGELHDKLMNTGAKLVLKTVSAIEKNDYSQICQSTLIEKDTILKTAPKIFKEDCKISWKNDILCIYNLIRGLNPYPAAWTELISPSNKEILLKIFKAEIINEKHSLPVGNIISDNKTYLNIAVNKGFISLKEVQLEGKKRLKIEEFLRGFDVENLKLDA